MVEQKTGDESEHMFFEDFGSGELNRSKWNVRITGKVVNDEQQAYVDSPETIYVASGPEAEGADGNVLVLHPRFRPGHTSPDGDRFDFQQRADEGEAGILDQLDGPDQADQRPGRGRV